MNKQRIRKMRVVIFLAALFLYGMQGQKLATAENVDRQSVKEGKSSQIELTRRLERSLLENTKLERELGTEKSKLITMDKVMLEEVRKQLEDIQSEGTTILEDVQRGMRVLKNKYNKLRVDNNALAEEDAYLKNSREEILREKGLVENELEEFRNAYAELQSAEHKLRQENRGNFEKELEKLRKELKDKETYLKKQAEIFKIEVMTLNSRERTLENQVATFTTTNFTIKEDLEKCQQLKKRLDQVYEELKIENMKLKDKILAMKVECSRETAIYVNKSKLAELKVVALSEKVDGLRKKLNSKETEILREREALRDRKSALKQAMIVEKKLKSELEISRRELKDREKHSHEQVETFKAQSVVFNDRESELKMVIVDLKDKLNVKLRSVQEKSQAREKDIKTKNMNLKNELEALRLEFLGEKEKWANERKSFGIKEGEFIVRLERSKNEKFILEEKIKNMEVNFVKQNVDMEFDRRVMEFKIKRMAEELDVVHSTFYNAGDRLAVNSQKILTEKNQIRKQKETVEVQLRSVQARIDELQGSLKRQTLSRIEREKEIASLVRNKQKLIDEVKKMKKNESSITKEQNLFKKKMRNFKRKMDKEKNIIEREKAVIKQERFVAQYKTQKLSKNLAMMRDKVQGSDHLLKKRDAELRKYFEQAEQQEKRMHTLKMSKKELSLALEKSKYAQESMERHVESSRTTISNFKKKMERERMSMHYNLAVVYERNGMFVDSEREYLKCLTTDSGDPDVYYNLAILYDDKLNRNKEAIYYYKKFLEFNSNNKQGLEVNEWILNAEKEMRVEADFR